MIGSSARRTDTVFFGVLPRIAFGFLVAGLLAGGPAASQACSEPASRHFDFWVGHWRVEDGAGALLGRSRIERILGGCALSEHWRGRGDYSGRSLNTWDSSSGRWRQFWTDNHGLSLYLSGGWQDGAMRLQGERQDTEGRRVVDRIHWVPLDDGRVRQSWEQSVDGDPFKTVFDGFYVPVRGEDAD